MEDLSLLGVMAGGLFGYPRVPKHWYLGNCLGLLALPFVCHRVMRAVVAVVPQLEKERSEGSCHHIVKDTSEPAGFRYLSWDGVIQPGSFSSFTGGVQVDASAEQTSNGSHMAI